MELFEHTATLAGFPLLDLLKGLIALCGLLAGVFFAAAAVAMAALFLPFAAIATLMVGKRGEKGRQGWHPVPA